jgi:hypothetical protein
MSRIAVWASMGALVTVSASGCGGDAAPVAGWNTPGADGGGGSGSSGGGLGGSGSGSGSGSSSGGGSSGSSSSGARAGSSSGGSGSSSGASSSGSSGGADAGMTAGDSGSSDPDVAYAVTLTMSPFSVGASQEVFMCQDFANPFKGQQADIKTYELHMAQGSHHMFAFYTNGATNGSVVTCPQGGLQFSAFTFSAQSPNLTQTYPQGIGATIPTSTGFTLNVHYINASSTAIPGQVSLTMYVAKPGIITQHAGVLFLNQISLSVPAMTTVAKPFSATAMLSQDVNILWSGSHMHQRASKFVATASSGQTLFQTTQWSDPAPATYSPALHLASGTSITWSCSYTNETTQPLTFGESAASNVMCISSSIFYPVQDITNPVISVMR